jgi:hypothetical protein
MAIKPRRQATPEAIEAFGDAAEPTSATPPTPSPAPTVAAHQRPSTPGEWPAGLARALQIRYPDPSLPKALADLAARDERSQHAIAVRALRRGLEELAKETP